MLVFLETTLSFPTSLFSLLLALVTIYWMLVCVGIFDLEPIEIDMQAVTAADRPKAGMSAAVLCALGLADVPRMVTLTLIALFGWPSAYFIQLWLLSSLDLGIFHYPLGLFAALLVVMLAGVCAAIVVGVCRPVLNRIKGPPAPPICGQVAVVRSPLVNRHKGHAFLNDGGAGLVLQVRTLGTEDIMRGERVVLLQYIPDEHAYYVVSESQFNK